MKTLIFAISILFGSYTALGQFNHQAVQQQLEEAENKAYGEQSDTAYEQVYDLISQMEDSSHWQSYWKAYTNLSESTLHAHMLNNLEEAKNLVRSAKETMLSIEDKNSEDWVLMAYIQSMNMQFVPPAEMMNANALFADYIDNAKEMDENNPRLYYVAGMYDMYTPVQFGGGQLYKKYLQKAQSLFATSESEIKWGKEETDELLEKDAKQ